MLDRTANARIIFEEEFRRQLRRPGWRIFTVGIPIIMLLVAFVVPVVLDAFDDDDGESVENLIGYIDDSGVTDSLEDVRGIIRFTDLAVGTKSLADGGVKALFVIPADYVSVGRVDWYRKSSGLASGSGVGDGFHNILRAAIADESLAPELVARILKPAEYVVFTVDDEGRSESSGSLQDQVARAAPAFIFAMLLLISIFVGTASLLQSVSEEKENRMVEMLITSTSPMSIMMGKIFGLGAAGLLQIGIWLTAVVFTVPRISDQFSGLSSLSLEFDLIILLIAFYFAGYFVFAALMASIGAATTTVREASQISAIVMIPAIVPIYSSAIIIQNPDGVLARVLTFFPLTAATASMMRIAGGTTKTYEVLIGLALTALAGVFLMWLSARVFRAGLLLYGQRMGIRNVLRALRQADY
ncbi:MAG: ABC transporter permease [Dehalococcoidia bacterium]